MNDLIKGIDAAVFQSELCVMEAIINMIDKERLITEYDNECACADVIMESMIIFMESKNRVRDRTPRTEIAKWMDEKGYWYTGDNPKKKKECNRMYHFLQQHKFDPKTTTYESDIDDGKGGKKRIKFTVNAVGMSLKPEDQSGMTMKGNPYVSLTSKTLKRPQHTSQWSLKHEEGHADQRIRYNGDDMKDSDDPEIAEFIKNSKNDLIVNKHDSKVSELDADRYGVTHAKIRTKGHSPKNTDKVRNYSTSDFKQNCILMAKDLYKNGLASLNTFEADKKYLVSCVKSIDECIKYNTITTANLKNVVDCLEAAGYKSTSSRIIKICQTIDKVMDGLSEFCSAVVSDPNNDSEINKLVKVAKTDKDKLSNSKSKISNIVNLGKDAGEKITNQALDKLKSFRKKAFDVTVGRKLMSDQIKPNLKQTRKMLMDAIKEVDTVIDSHKKFMDQSTEMRYKFSKQFIKEYFDELSDDMCYYD